MFVISPCCQIEFPQWAKYHSKPWKHGDKQNRQNSLCHRAFGLVGEGVFAQETHRNQIK